MLNYTQAKELLKNRASKKLALNTYLNYDTLNDLYVIKYHNTDIIKINVNNNYVLNNGGYYTKTTKERLNEFSSAIINQHKYEWYITDLNGVKSVFYNDMIVDQHGAPLKAKNITKKALNAQAQAKKHAKKYAIGFNNHAKNGGITTDLKSDCWYCSLFIPQGVNNSNDHIKEHIKEGYFVNSLLLNAIKERGYNNPGFIYHLAMSGSYDITPIIYKYVLKELLNK